MGAISRLIVFEILSVVLQLLSIVFNGAIICTLSRRSLLKYPSNRFVFSLCLSHLVVSFLSITISFVSIFLPYSPTVSTYKGSHYVSVGEDGHLLSANSLLTSGKGSNGGSLCSTNGVDLAHLIMMHINFGVAVCTSITVALISTERYITIARPMRYKSIVTARRSLYAIICCWLLSTMITMMPLTMFENRHPVCGTFSVPMESLATYFGIVFSVVTVFALAVMIVCYTHIFRIAKAKCQKVQIGHLSTSTVSSISSDWPSSAAYSSAQGQNRSLHAGSRIESSNSLLHWVLMTNLGRHVQPLRIPNALRGGLPVTPPGTPTLPPKNAFFSESALNSRRESDETTTTGAGTSRNGSTSSSGGGGGEVATNSSSSYFIDPSRFPLFHYNHAQRKLRNRWKTYLQPNYNSPRKTIFTIVLLIGAVLFTQLPLSFVLFTTTVEATQRWFQFCTTVLFSTSSVANPILYGFLNRSIRDQLWRLLKRSPRGGEHGPSASSFRKRKRGHQQQLEEIAQHSKGFLSSANHRHLQSILCRGEANRSNGRIMEIPAIKISRKESISSEDDNSSVNSVASSSSINVIGTNGPNDPPSSGPIRIAFASGAKARLHQVHKRLASASPYYRTVLLKKANSISKSNSLLPRLALPLPNVNVRRNSSGSVINSRGTISNGVMSNKKEKVKEVVDKEWSSSSSSINKLNDDDKDELDYCEKGEAIRMVEMKSARNYSTPDLQLSLSSFSTPTPTGLIPERSEDEPTLNLNKGEGSTCGASGTGGDTNNDSDLVSDGIEIKTENKIEGQLQLRSDNECKDGVTKDTFIIEEKMKQNEDNENAKRISIDENSTSYPTDALVEDGSLSSSASESCQLQPQPGSSQTASVDEKYVEEDSRESCLSSDNNLMGAVIVGDLLPENFPRKPSQDSGADMSFSDEEDEMPTQPPPNDLNDHAEVHHQWQHHCHCQEAHRQLLSTGSLGSLPGATVALILKTEVAHSNGTGDDNVDAAQSSSPDSLSDPLFSSGYPDPDVTGNNDSRKSSPHLSTSPMGIVLLPCSCRNQVERGIDSGNRIVETTPTEQNEILHNMENGVTVTLTGNSDSTETNLFNPELFLSNRSLLHVQDLDLHYRCRCHRSDCKQKEIGKPHKSKSESDICNQKKDSDMDLKIRSNCHINRLVLDVNNKLKNDHQNIQNPTFTLVPYTYYCSSCDIAKDEDHVIINSSSKKVQKNSDSDNLSNTNEPPCWFIQPPTGHLPLALNCSRSLEQISQRIHNISRNDRTNVANSLMSLPVMSMSVKSSFTSLSSTCPFGILEGHNKSDISDYEDLEDHIEI